MDKLYFLANWGEERQKAWSGTYYGIYTALQRFFCVKDIELKAQRNLFDKIRYNIFKTEDMNLSRISQYRAQVAHFFKQKRGIPIFQFEEVVFNSNAHSTYIYQDLSASYVKYLSEANPEVFKYSGFSMNSRYAMHKRCKEQMTYYRTCSGIFTMGNWIRKDLIERCGIAPEKVCHVGGGINLDRSLINPDSREGNKILFVGRDFLRKGGFLVYEAFKLLKSDMPDLQLYVAGPSDNPIRQPIDGYYYWGDCDHATLSGLFNKCDVFCMPSYFEAYGLVFIEALAYGLPCIGRNAYEMPYFIEQGETGFLLEKDHVEELVTLIKELLSNERIKKNVIDRRESYLQKYTWDAVAERIYHFIVNNAH